jgi:HEPN domain-containing protein
MEIEAALEWFYFADADLDSAKILNAAYRKHNEIICYHCQQAVEKYLKGFLCFNGIAPPRIHVLENLCALCSSFDTAFNQIAMDCTYLSPFAVHSRYPFEITITDANMEKALKIAETIKKYGTPPLRKQASMRLAAAIAGNYKSLTEACPTKNRSRGATPMCVYFKKEKSTDFTD